MRDLGASVLAVAGDVSLTADVNRLFAQTRQTFGTVDVLVNNAADLRRVQFFEGDEVLLDSHSATNIRGPYLCAHRLPR